MGMTCFELKKIFSRSANQVAFVILLVSLYIVSYFSIGYADYVDRDGKKTRGIAAASALREEKSQWEGYVTEEVLQKVLEENARINGSEEYRSADVTENDKAYSKKQGFSDLREMINRSFCAFQEYSYFRADSVTSGELSSFYTNRVEILKKWLSSEEQKARFSRQEQEFLITQYEKLETPVYYADADGWKALLEYLPTMIMLLVLVSGFWVSGIFSDEVLWKTDSIFFSAKLGRNRAVSAKIKAGFFLLTVVYWAIVLVYSAIVLMILGSGGAGCVIQSGMENWKSFYNITYFQDYLMTVLGGYLGNLFILFLVMAVSAKTRSKTLAVTIPFLLLFLPSFLSGSDRLSVVVGLLPDQLLQICTAVKTFYVYQFGTKVVGSVPIILFLYFILFCILVPVVYQIYRKTEVK